MATEIQMTHFPMISTGYLIFIIYLFNTHKIKYFFTVSLKSLLRSPVVKKKTNKNGSTQYLQCLVHMRDRQTTRSCSSEGNAVCII